MTSSYLWHPFRQEGSSLPLLSFVRGKGIFLYTADGQEYLDLVASWWVNTHGHAHPKIAAAIAEQAQTLEQVLFADATHPPALALAAKLIQWLPHFNRVFFTDNGSSAVEAALKIAYQYWFNQGKGQRKRFLAFEGGYHGDTFGAMSAGHSSGFYKPFEPFLFQVQTMPYPATWFNDANIDYKETAALKTIETNLRQYSDETAAFILEPLIQGASGMRFSRPQFLEKVVTLVKSYGVLTIFDEVMTGFGRTGTMFACDQLSQSPDIICLAKGLTGGFLPLAVTLVTEEIYQAFVCTKFDKAFAHGHSYAANPLGCAAALATLQLFEEENTLIKIDEIQAVHRQQLVRLADHPHVEKSRVQGSVAAFNIRGFPESEHGSLGQKLKKSFFERRLFLRPLGNVIYILPPYCITSEQLIDSYDLILEVLNDL